jgi:Tol biopolymer transport system component
MKRSLFMAILVFASVIPLFTTAQDPAPRRLLIAFSSYRDRPKHARVYFYEHDGVSKGKIVDSIDPVQNRQDYHPIVSSNGKICAFASELENQSSKVFVYDLTQKKLVTPKELNKSPGAQLHPSVNADGTLVAFASWDKPGASQRWDVMLFSIPGTKFLDTPGLNTPKFDEHMPALSADGRWLAYVSNRTGGVGLADIWLYDRKAQEVVAIPEINSAFADLTPCLSADGKLIAFASDRPTGKGGRDIYLYDRSKKSFLPLPGVNSVANEQTPSLSPDGRYLAFVSERIKGEGERDIYLYDRATQKLLPTPGLNSKREDMDPCVIVLE